MNIQKIKVYAKLNENNEITEVNSSIFLTDVTDWIEIDEGEGDKFSHAQSQYFANGVTDEYNRCNYKLIDGEVVEITDKHDVEVEPQITTEERLEALESAMLELLLGGMK